MFILSYILQTVLANAKKLLAKEVLAVLDVVATEVFASRQIKMFPYSTMRETVNLVMVTLLRELLAYQNGKRNFRFFFFFQITFHLIFVRK